MVPAEAYDRIECICNLLKNPNTLPAYLLSGRDLIDELKDERGDD